VRGRTSVEVGMVSIISLACWPNQASKLIGGGKLKKGRRTHDSIRTRKPSSPIISSLEALLARRQFHPRTPI
jgi:hypothetical protein